MHLAYHRAKWEAKKYTVKIKGTTKKFDFDFTSNKSNTWKKVSNNDNNNKYSRQEQEAKHQMPRDTSRKKSNNRRQKSNVR